jgi:hypothetical protein
VDARANDIHVDARKAQAMRHFVFARNYLEVPGMKERIEAAVKALDGDVAAMRDESERERLVVQNAAVHHRSQLLRLEGVNLERLQEVVSVPAPRVAAGNALKITLPTFPDYWGYLSYGDRNAHEDGTSCVKLSAPALKKLNLSVQSVEAVSKLATRWWGDTVRPFVLRAESTTTEQSVSRALGVSAMSIDPAAPHALEISLSGDGNYCKITVPSDATVEDVEQWLRTRHPLASHRDDGTLGWPYLKVRSKMRELGYRSAQTTRERERHAAKVDARGTRNAAPPEEKKEHKTKKVFAATFHTPDPPGSGGDWGYIHPHDERDEERGVNAEEHATVAAYLDSFDENVPGTRYKWTTGLAEYSKDGDVSLSMGDFTVAAALSFAVEPPRSTLTKWVADHEAKMKDAARRQAARDVHVVEFSWTHSSRLKARRFNPRA